MNIIQQTPLSWANCPTRRKPLVAPWTGNKQGNMDSSISMGAKADYAVNAGDTPDPCSFGGSTANWTGISYERSEITIAHIFDGTSNTYMLGEKYLGVDNYFAGMGSDNECMYSGSNHDTARTTCNDGWHMPLQDRMGFDSSFIFGSAHASGFCMAFCDGSVHWMSYSIDPETHRRLGNRKDGLSIDASKF